MILEKIHGNSWDQARIQQYFISNMLLNLNFASWTFEAALQLYKFIWHKVKWKAGTFKSPTNSILEDIFYF